MVVDFATNDYFNDSKITMNPDEKVDDCKNQVNYANMAYHSSYVVGIDHYLSISNLDSWMDVLNSIHAYVDEEDYAYVSSMHIIVLGVIKVVYNMNHQVDFHYVCSSDKVVDFSLPHQDLENSSKKDDEVYYGKPLVTQAIINDIVIHGNDYDVVRWDHVYNVYLIIWSHSIWFLVAIDQTLDGQDVYVDDI